MPSQAVLDALTSPRRPADILAAREARRLEALALEGARKTRIENALPAGKTYEEALARASARKRRLWTRELPFLQEEGCIAALEKYCIALCGGDRLAGKQLATDAMVSA
jgi:hypothetical protein